MIFDSAQPTARRAKIFTHMGAGTKQIGTLVHYRTCDSRNPCLYEILLVLEQRAHIGTDWVWDELELPKSS